MRPIITRTDWDFPTILHFCGPIISTRTQRPCIASAVGSGILTISVPPKDFLSNYHGTNIVVNSNSPLDALRRASAKVTYAPGLSSIEYACVSILCCPF
eukprot:COSAG01_NODE_7332_length_3247_cov_2.094663_5_plen_99_part_00